MADNLCTDDRKGLARFTYELLSSNFFDNEIFARDSGWQSVRFVARVSVCSFRRAKSRGGEQRVGRRKKEVHSTVLREALAFKTFQSAPISGEYNLVYAEIITHERA